MSRFLFAVWPFSGHLHPAIAIAHALVAKGHQVGFYTGGSARHLIEGEGFPFFPFVRIDEDRIQNIVANEFKYCPDFWSRLRNAKNIAAKFREWMIDTIPHQVDDFKAIFNTWRPDVMMCDLAFWGPILVLHETERIPVAVLSVAAACLLPGRDIPAWGPGKPLPRTSFARLLTRVDQQLLRWVSVAIRKPVNVIRQRYGLAPIEVPVTEFAGRMPLYLVPSSPEFDYQRDDLPPSMHYVGPCLWDKPGSLATPDWLARLPDEQPLIYVTEATVGQQEPFLLKAAAEAFRDRPVQVVMTTGKQRKTAGLMTDMPANVRVEQYIPQSDLLPKMAVMVTLGGSGGVLAALTAGVPLVVVPTEWDRPENAQRLVEAGAAIRIDSRDCTPERLRKAVERVLTEPSFRQNSRRLGNSFARYGGASYAAELLETLHVSTANGPVLRADCFV